MANSKGYDCSDRSLTLARSRSRSHSPRSVRSRSMSASRKKKERRAAARPAFEGAPFDRRGHCVKHRSVQLAEEIEEDGRLMWKEVKMNCPKCAAEHHKSRRVTSLGGAGKVKKGRTVHGMSNPLRDSQKAGRHMDKEFDTPFDDKGRCHHHPNVQMASKKLRGGWNLLLDACPRCIEAKYDEDALSEDDRSRASSRHSRRSKSRDRDDRSVSSKSSKRSVASRTPAVAPGANFDKNGCCTRHPTVQIAKKKLLGGWKEYRTCPKCLDPAYDDLADNGSVTSRRSNASRTSFRSTGSARSGRSRKSVKSNSSRKGGRKTDRYGALPFDEEGYCHAHPAVRLAKKKALGGWKVLHDICPDCAQDASSNAGSSRSKSSRRSGTGRVYDESGSDASSHKSGKSGRSTGSRKKKIRVKDMRFTDESGKEGRYSGDVDEDHVPHGQGKMKYRDGSVFAGVWNEGAQVHGKTSKGGSRSSSRSKKSSSSDWARRDGKGVGGKLSASPATKAIEAPKDKDIGEHLAATGRQKVRKMKWMDFYGDPGQYTGEVNAENMPDGKGSMKYDHGLIQEGRWSGGQLVCDASSAAAATAVAGNKSRAKKSSRSGGSSGGSRKQSSSSSRAGGSSRSRNLDP